VGVRTRTSALPFTKVKSQESKEHFCDVKLTRVRWVRCLGQVRMTGRGNVAAVYGASASWPSQSSSPACTAPLRKLFVTPVLISRSVSENVHISHITNENRISRWSTALTLSQPSSREGKYTQADPLAFCFLFLWSCGVDRKDRELFRRLPQ
jgi:hypothetical protein